MRGITARLPQGAGMGDNVAFVVNVPRGVFLGDPVRAGSQ
jgi:hypothetical protein